MEIKVLLSTQETTYEKIGSPGCSLPLFIFADFFSKYLNLKIDIYDPIYNASEYIDSPNFRIVSYVKKNDYDLIINHQFFITTIKLFGFNFGNNSKNFYSINALLKYIFQSSPLFGLKENDPISLIKELAVPFVYYYDWLVRWNHKVVFSEKISKSRLILSKYNSKKIFALHIRSKSNHWKKIKNSLSDNEFNIFIKKLAKQILNDKNNVLWIYGTESKNSNLYKELLSYGAIDVQRLSQDSFDLSLILSDANIFISGVNGYTLFSTYLAWSKGNLENTYIVNDISNPLENGANKELWCYDRYCSDLILDKQSFTNSNFFSKQRFYPKDTLLNEEIIEKNHKKANIKQNQNIKKYELFLYYIDEQCNSYFGKQIDNYIIKILSLYLNKLFFNSKVTIIKDKNDLSKISEKRLLHGQHVLTHFRIKSKLNNSPENQPRTYFQIKEKLNPSNILFLDLFQAMVLIINKWEESNSRVNSIKYVKKITSNKGNFKVNFEIKNNSNSIKDILFYIRYVKVFYSSVHTRGFIYAIRQTKNFLKKNINKKNKAKKLKIMNTFTINPDTGVFKTINGNNISLKKYIKLVREAENIYTESSRLVILNNFLNCKKPEKTIVLFEKKQDLKIMNDLPMILNPHLNISIEDLSNILPIKKGLNH